MTRHRLLASVCSFAFLAGCARGPDPAIARVNDPPPVKKDADQAAPDPVPLDIQAGADQAPKKGTDRDLLQGYWLMYRSSIDGVTNHLEVRDVCFALIKPNEFGVQYKEDKAVCEMTLDSSSDPRKIDLIHVMGKNRGARDRGIYRIEKDRFSLCLALEDNRPEEFSTPRGSGTRLFEFRRLTPIEEKAFAGTLPADSWIKEKSRVGRCEVSFPVRPRVASSESRAQMLLQMRITYRFSCERVREISQTDAERLKTTADDYSRKYGKLVRTREMTSREGYPKFEFLLESPKKDFYIEGRLTIANDFLYEQYVQSSKTLVETPNVNHFFESLVIRVPTVKELLADFESNDAHARNMTIKALNRRGAGAIPEISAGLSDPSERIRSGAVQSLGTFGPAAKEAVPKLERLLSDPSSYLRADVVRTLEKIGSTDKVGAVDKTGPSAITVMVKSLPSDTGNYFDLTAALDRMDSNWRKSQQAKLAVPTLIAGLSASDDRQRRRAIMALAELGPLAKDAVPSLIVFLSDRDQDTRSAAVFAMFQMGPDASGAKAALLRLFEDPLPQIRKNAAQSLGNIGPSVLPDLVQALSVKKAAVRVAAVQAMGHLGPQGKDAVPHLIRALADESGNVKLAAIDSLGKLGPLAVEALPALEAITDSIYVQESQMTIKLIRK